LDINGMALSFHAVPGLGPATARAAVAQATRFDADTFRQRRPQLVARRDAELATAYRLLGGIPVSQPLPNTPIRKPSSSATTSPERSRHCPEHPHHSARDLVERNRDPQDPLKLRDFAFVHMPGGHAPMIDFVDNPYLGELLNTLHEDGVLISLICHAPVAMVSTRYRVAADGEISTTSDHHFKGAQLTAVPKHAEVFALTTAYPKVPGHKTRLTYYVDEALKEAGYQVETATNPAAVRVVYDEKANLLTGNGPQAIDDQAAKLRQLLDGASQRGRPATTRTPA
jgi:putative intracellular protease/amidase